MLKEFQKIHDVNAVECFASFFESLDLESFIDLGRKKKAAHSLISQYERLVACTEMDAMQMQGESLILTSSIVYYYFIKSSVLIFSSYSVSHSSDLKMVIGLLLLPVLLDCNIYCYPKEVIYNE